MATAIAEPPHLTADLKALYLSTVASQWRSLAEQAARQRQAPADYLAQLVHLEVTGHRERRIQRRIQDARFPMLKTFGRLLVRGAAGPRPRRGPAGLRLPLRRRGRQRCDRRRRRAVAGTPERRQPARRPARQTAVERRARPRRTGNDSRWQDHIKARYADGRLCAGSQ